MLARATMLATAFACCGVALAADDEMPEMEFFEYLGMWEESDEEWLIFEEPTTADNEVRTDPAPEGKESEENDDES